MKPRRRHLRLVPRGARASDFVNPYQVNGLDGFGKRLKKLRKIATAPARMTLKVASKSPIGSRVLGSGVLQKLDKKIPGGVLAPAMGPLGPMVQMTAKQLMPSDPFSKRPAGTVPAPLAPADPFSPAPQAAPDYSQWPGYAAPAPAPSYTPPPAPASSPRQSAPLPSGPGVTDEPFQESSLPQEFDAPEQAGDSTLPSDYEASESGFVDVTPPPPPEPFDWDAYSGGEPETVGAMPMRNTVKAQPKKQAPKPKDLAKRLADALAQIKRTNPGYYPYARQAVVSSGLMEASMGGLDGLFDSLGSNLANVLASGADAYAKVISARSNAKITVAQAKADADAANRSIMKSVMKDSSWTTNLGTIAVLVAGIGAAWYIWKKA